MYNSINRQRSLGSVLCTVHNKVIINTLQILAAQPGLHEKIFKARMLTILVQQPIPGPVGMFSVKLHLCFVKVYVL